MAELSSSMEEDPDKDLLLDWRGGAKYAAPVRMQVPPLMPHQSLLPFKQKETMSSDATFAKKEVDTTTTFSIPLVTKPKKATSQAGDARNVLMRYTRIAPVVYELSDSEESPTTRPIPTNTTKGRAIARNPDAGLVVDLGSDSDNEVVSSAVEKSRVPAPLTRKNLEKTSLLIDGNIVASESPFIPNLLSSRYDFPTVAPIESEPSKLLDVSPASKKKLDRKAADYQLPNSFVCGSGMFLNHTDSPQEFNPHEYATRECFQPIHVNSAPVEDLTADYGYDSEAEWMHDVDLLSSRLSGLEADGVYAGDYLPKLGNSGGTKRESIRVEAFDSLDSQYRKSDCFASGEDIDKLNCVRLDHIGLKELDPDHSATRKCFQPIHVNSAPVEDLTADDGYHSEPEWMRNVVPRFSSLSGVKAYGSYAGDYIAKLGTLGTTERGSIRVETFDSLDHQYRKTDCFAASEDIDKLNGVSEIAKKKDATTKEARNLIVETQVIDLDDNDENVRPPCKKVSKGRKRPLSEEERAAREAQRLIERDLKKAQQEEAKRLREEKKEELKRQKEAAKVEAAERRKLEKETERWKKGKFALQSTTAYLDTTVIEMKDVGRLIIGQLGEKDYKFKVGSNPIQRSIIWKMKWPSADSEGLGTQSDYGMNSQVSDSQVVLEEVEIKYVVVIFQGDEFATMIAEKKLHAHICMVQKQYPRYSLCYLVNGLMKYLYKKEQHQFKTGEGGWVRPNVEQVLAELLTHYSSVHSRLCIDESEMADHVVGLMRSLAECPFKQKLTSLSVNANGDHVTKGDPNKDIIKKNTWLKVLVAIPHITGAIAIAIAKEYPTMRSLLKVYLDPLKTVLEKEFLLQDIVKDASLGALRTEGRRVGPVASRRIHRVLMAQDGNLRTEDAEEGADHFTDTT